MPSFSSKRRVRHDSTQMFDLVADVEKYPQFVPLCNALRVKSRVAKGEGVEVLIADMTVAYKVIRETFTSRVTLDKPNLKILVEYLDGPFKRMENRWMFQPADEDDSEIEFFINYEFKSRVLAMLMGAMFDTAFRHFSAAFEKRADDIYGNKTA
ncbi:MAG: type II toxin-antitoxin system RatA family toxin [Pseudolabrys sp.]